MQNLKNRENTRCVNKQLIANLLEVINEVSALLENPLIITRQTQLSKICTNFPQSLVNLAQEVKHLQLENYYDVRKCSSSATKTNASFRQKEQKTIIIQNSNLSKTNIQPNCKF